LDDRTRYFRDHVEVAAIDPHAGYRKALVSSLPRTTITVDVFHAVKLANSAVDDVRRRVQRETLGHRGHNDDPLSGIRRLLTRGYERLSDKQRARITEALRRGDPYDEVGGAWAVKEQLRLSVARFQSPLLATKVPTPQSGCSGFCQRRSVSLLTRFLHAE
jgi:hypothetical protein